MRHGPDYDLIDRLMLADNRRQDAYVAQCPHIAYLRELAAEYSLEYWWGRVPDWPGNGMAEVNDDEDPLIIADQVSGEIVNDTDLCDDCGRGDGHDADCFYHGPY